jgi:hypothetical protein
MTIAIIAVIALAGIASTVASIWILILEFRKNIWWGLGSIFMHWPVTLVFGIMYWSEMKKPFLLWAVSYLLIAVAIAAGAVLIPNIPGIR